MEALTVNQLASALEYLKKKGMGDKKIMLSSDDEGNEYHLMFFGVNINAKRVFEGEYAPYMPWGVTEKNLDDYVILA